MEVLADGLDQEIRVVQDLIFLSTTTFCTACFPRQPQDLEIEPILPHLVVGPVADVFIALRIADLAQHAVGHEVFVLKDVAASAQGEGGEGILGAFYIKPNFPGRCNHICNHG